jgi:hypothetical protein
MSQKKPKVNRWFDTWYTNKMEATFELTKALHFRTQWKIMSKTSQGTQSRARIAIREEILERLEE